MNDLVLILLIAGMAWIVWRAISSNFVAKVVQTETEPSPKDAPEMRHIQSALAFAKSQHKLLADKQRQQDHWQRQHGHSAAEGLDKLTGVEFEEFLAGLFRAQGYNAELTPQTGDYGADLILEKDGSRIAVQAKRYVGSVGVAAVQEALSGQAYYRCDAAWVATTGTFTANAMELAEKSGVRLIGRSDIGIIMTKVKAGNDQSI